MRSLSKERGHRPRKDLKIMLTKIQSLHQIELKAVVLKYRLKHHKRIGMMLSDSKTESSKLHDECIDFIKEVISHYFLFLNPNAFTIYF